MRLIIDGRSENPAADRLKGADFARRALEVAGDDPGILANAAQALAYFGEDIGAMMALVDRALSLNPNFARLAHWRHAQGLGGPARHRDRASRCRAAPQSPRPHRHVALYNRHRAFRQPALRRSRPATTSRHPGGPSLPSAISLSCRLLRAHGPARRRPRDRRAATGHYLCRDTRRRLPAEPRRPRAFAVGPAHGDRERDMSQTRRLAAILAADVAGYSRLMGADEEGTLERLKALRRELLDPKIAEHHGRIVKTTGDGLLVEFASVVDAVRCALAVQQAMPERNTGVGADSRIELRIGINLGDVIVEDGDIFGDGVNIAARIEALADAGGVLVSNTVHDHVRDRLPFLFEDRGEQQVKNIARPVRVYRVRDAAGPRSPSAPAPPVLPLPDKPSIAVLPFANMSGDPEQEYFADGMVEEIITALSRIR